MCPVWLLVAVAVVGVANGSATQCFEHPSCQEGNSESSLMDCILLCRAELTGDTPLPPLSLPSPPASSSQQQTKRSYSMEHFRWGKPVGRKRRPIKVYTSNGVEEESAEVFPGEMRRRELPSDLIVSEEDEKDQVEQPEVEHLSDDNDHEKKDGTYKMKHFRWGGPPASKRYGGFMKSWEEQQSQRPLLTLFKNVINKEGPQQ